MIIIIVVLYSFIDIKCKAPLDKDIKALTADWKLFIDSKSFAIVVQVWYAMAIQ